MENLKRGDAFLSRTMLGSEEEAQEAKDFVPENADPKKQINKGSGDSTGDDDDDDDGEGNESDNSDRQERRRRRADRKVKAAIAQRRVPIVLPSLKLLQSVLEEQMQAYIDSWESLFPDTRSNELLESIDELRYDESSVLSKAQRYAVKQWYGEVAQNLRRKVGEGTVHAVLASDVRTKLIEGVMEVVESKFKDMEDYLEEKEWSTRPLNSILQSPEDWLAEIQRMF